MQVKKQVYYKWTANSWYVCFFKKACWSLVYPRCITIFLTFYF